MPTMEVPEGAASRNILKRQQNGASSGQMKPRVLVFEIMAEQPVVTSGSTSYVYTTITSPELAELAPYIEDIQVVAELKEVSTNFRFKVIGQKSYRGDAWTDFAADVLAEQSAAASPINGSVYATRSDLSGPKIRLRLGIKNQAGTAVETGTISMILIVRLYT